MLSLYIHIPFCRHKCDYCSFHVIPEDKLDQSLIETRKDEYMQYITRDIQQRKKIYADTPIKTIYIGGGTPFQLGRARLLELIDTLLETWNTEFLEELTIELNPDPLAEVLDFVSHCQEKYRHLYKLRFSLGIQTLDGQLLEQSGRNYTYAELTEFLRQLRLLKKHHGIHFNGDFIAFGNHTWTSDQETFFQNLLKAHLFDSVSLYTLELFPGSDRRNEQQHLTTKNTKLRGNDDAIMEEFDRYRTLLQQTGYRRYEISNFSLMGRRSIHNMVYRNHGSYLGLGPSGASFLTGEQLAQATASSDRSGLDIPDHTLGVRWKNSLNRKQRSEQSSLTPNQPEYLSHEALAYEKIMLGLRTDHGIPGLSSYSSVLVDDRTDQVQCLQDEGFCTLIDDTLRLTDSGFSVYNTIITQLLK